MHYFGLLTLSSTFRCSLSFTVWIWSYVVNSTIKNLFCTLLRCHSYAVAGDITTQPKQGRQAGPMSSLCILLCLWVLPTPLPSWPLGHRSLGSLPLYILGSTELDLHIHWCLHQSAKIYLYIQQISRVYKSQAFVWS